MYDEELEELTERGRSQLLRGLSEIAKQPADCLGVVAVRAPVGPLSVFLAGGPRDASFLWSPPSGMGFAGYGKAFAVMPQGPSRYAELELQLADLRRRVCLRADGVEFSPRLFGGVSFHLGMTDAVWTEFGEGELVLPRWTYARDSDTALLALAVTRDEAASLDANLLAIEEFEQCAERLVASESRVTRVVNFGPSGLPRDAVRQMPYAVWERYLEQIRAVIGTGQFKKIVAARRAEVPIAALDNDLDIITRLSAEPGCSRFAFRRPTSSFIGATPETLISRRGAVLRTQALAGTTRSTGSEFPRSQRAAELLRSPKDASEHEHVVREILRKLEPYSASISHAPSPLAYKVRDLIHLNTPFEATLKPDVDSSTLLGLLHPTPAIGGLPSSEAAAWIAVHEPIRRGWYSGPVGWIDLKDDCEFVVAIRSGVLTARTAYVFTGAGVVLESDTYAEYMETELKQMPLLRALGVRDSI